MDVIYRCCEAEVKPPYKLIRPNWFNKIKCLESFLRAVDFYKDGISSLTFLHDGDKGEIYERIKDFNVISVDYKSNEKSLMETFEIADKLSGDSIYFVEDDYLHINNSIEKIHQAVKKLKLVNGYDHLDRYIRADDISFRKESIVFLENTNLHWRTAESTCCTWAATREMWNHIKEDCRYFRLRDRDLFRSLSTSKDIRLWTPIPGLTTQVDDKLSPGIDWEVFNADN